MRRNITAAPRGIMGKRRNIMKRDTTMFEKEAASGQDPDANAFAAATLPTLRMHLRKIQAIAAAAGVTQ
jgi:hypothetical protein